MELRRFEQLTERQRQLLELVAGGVTTSKTLAQATGIATGTVDNQLQIAARTLGVSGREAAAARYVELKNNSHETSHVRISALPNDPGTGPSRGAGIVWAGLTGIAEILGGPPKGSGPHSLGWDQITLQILRVAGAVMVTALGLVLVVLAMFRTFD